MCDHRNKKEITQEHWYCPDCKVHVWKLEGVVYSASWKDEQMTKYEEQMVRQVVDGNLDKVDVLDQMVLSGTIQTRDDYDKMARHISYRVVMRSEWNAAAEEK